MLEQALRRRFEMQEAAESGNRSRRGPQKWVRRMQGRRPADRTVPRQAGFSN